MILFLLIVLLISLYFLVPKGTNLHEVLRLPYYNYKAQTARKDEMIMEKHRYGKDSMQYFYLFLPKDAKVTQDQVIVYYHGGGWTIGNPMMFRCNAQFFTDRGYAVIMPTYRRLPRFRYPDMHQDAKNGLKKALEVLKEKGLEDKKLIISGLSSGGHIAGLLAFDQKGLEEINLPPNKIAGVMLLASPLDLSKMAKTTTLWRLAGNRNSDFFKASNPVYYLNDEHNFPVLLIHGTKDGLVNYQSALSFAAKYKSDRLTFYTIEDGTHLDSGYWIFFENETRKVLLNWLDNL